MIDTLLDIIILFMCGINACMMAIKPNRVGAVIGWALAALYYGLYMMGGT